MAAKSSDPHWTDGVSRDTMQVALEQFYSLHNPNKCADVPLLLLKFHGRWGALVAEVEAKVS